MLRGTTHVDLYPTSRTSTQGSGHVVTLTLARNMLFEAVSAMTGHSKLCGTHSSDKDDTEDLGVPFASSLKAGQSVRHRLAAVAMGNDKDITAAVE